MSEIEILTGLPGAGQGERIFQELCARLRQAPYSFLYLVPTRRMVRALRSRILDEGGLRAFCPERILTLDDFAVQMFEKLHPNQRLISDNISRLILEAIFSTPGRQRFLKVSREGCTAGLIATAAKAIKQLKEHAVSPRSARDAARKMHHRDFADLAAVYAEYEESLKDLMLADLESAVLTLADAAVEQLRRALMPGLEALYVDGFSDFTPAQERLIVRLIGLAERTVFVVDFLPNRKDAFGPTEEMLASATRRTPSAKWQSRPAEAGPDREPGPVPLFGAIATRVFTRDAESAVDDANGHVQFMRPADRTAEVEAIAAQIKHVLIESNPPPMRRIAVTFPNMVEYAPLVREIFPRYGLDFNLSHEFPLAESPVAIATLAVVETVLNGFRREDVLRLLGSPCVEFHFGEDAILSEPLLRREAYLSGVIEGASDWQEKLERRAALLQAELDGMDTGSEEGAALDPDAERLRISSLVEDNAFVTKGVVALLGALAAFPLQGTVGEYCDTLKGLMRRFRIAQRLLPESPEHLPPVEIEKACQAYKRVCSLLDELAYAERQARRGNVSLAGFHAMLRVAFGESNYQVRTYDDVGVQVLGLLETRGLDFDVLFVGGLLNGEFPRWPRENILLSGEPARRLKLRSPESKLAVQRCHFIRLLCSARRCLTLSCPATVRGEPAVSSFFFDEAHRACGAPPLLTRARNEICSLERLQCMAGKWLTDVPSALAGEVAGFLARRAGEAGQLHFLLRNMNIERARRHETAALDLGAYAGILRNRAAETVGRDFGSRHLFSVRQLESYAQCPFRFFVESVLHVAEMEPPEEEMTPRTRGSLLHEALRRFYVARRRSGLGSISRDEQAEAAAELKRIIEAVFGEFPLKDLFWQKDVARLTGADGLAEAFIESECAAAGPCEPRYFEFAFGRPSRMGAVDGAAVRPPLTISPGLKTTGKPATPPAGKPSIRLAGKVDRVDVSPDDEAIVIDYKTGSVNPAQVRRDTAEGALFQLPIYLLAVRDLLQLKPAAGIYYRLRGAVDCGTTAVVLDEALQPELLPGTRSKTSAAKYLPDKMSLEEFLEMTERRTLALVGFIRAGRFPAGPVNPDDRRCAYCDYRQICRWRADWQGP